MRCAFASITIVLLAVAGCRNQASPLTNPFLTPDRVPPPSTRALAPGTSQPVYAGDPLPGSTFGAPGSTTFAPPTTIGTPQVMPPTSYPAGAYPSGPLTPAPVTPTSPPTGWGGQPTAQNSTFVPGDSVQAPVDQQPLRFGTGLAAIGDGGAPAMRSIAAVQLPAAGQLPRAPGSFVSNAGAQAPIQQAVYDEAPPSSAGSFSRVQIREVTPAEYLEGRQASSLGTASGAAEAGPAGAGAKPQAGGAGAGLAMRDGFRPQGTTPPRESEPAQSFRTPEIHRDALEAEKSSARYGVGENQDWLRGQLEYWPESGQWSVRYMDPSGPADQIGGRVLIDNPQVLGNLPPGEFVMVRGQVFGRQIDDASYLPAYRVATVERQRL